MARSLTTLPTTEAMMKKFRRKAGLPTTNRRKKKRLSIEQINLMGDEQLREHLAKIREPEDKRTTFTKVMDAIDIPRNMVANVIGSLAGVEKKKLPTGALGVKRVMMSDVLKKLGVRGKVLRGVAGFVGDVAVDPLTYLSLGSATGIKMGAGLPRFLGKGLMKRTARAMTTGGAVPSQVAKAIGMSPQRLGQIGGKLVSKFGAKQATKRLFSRKAGWLTRMVSKRARGVGKATEASVGAAQKFLKGMAPKGRTLLRAPFAKRGLELPFGKQAKLFRRLGTPESIRQATRLGRAGARLGRKGAAVAKLGVQAAALAAKGKKGEAAAAKASQLQAFGRQQTLGASIRSAAMAPTAEPIIKGMALQKYGRQVLSGPELARLGAGPLTKAKHAMIRGKRAMFGEPVTQLRQQEQGLMTALRRGPEAGRRARAEIDPAVDALVAKYVSPGLKGKELTAARSEIGRRLTNLAEAGARPAASIGYPGSRLRQSIGALRQTPFAKDPDVVALLGKSKEMRGGMEAAQRGKQVFGAGGTVEGLGRHMTPEMQAFKAEEARRLVKTPFHPERETIRELTGAGPVGPARKFALEHGPEKAKLVKAGYTPGKSYPIPMEDWNFGINPQTGKPMAQRLIGPGTPKPQMFVTDFAEQTARDAASHEYKMATAQLRDYVVKQGAWQVPQAQAAATPWLAQPFGAKDATQGAFYQLTKDVLAPGGTPLLMDRPVAEMVDRMNHVMSSPQAVDKILRSYDLALGYWKTGALYHPGYIIRNIFQNIFGTVMGGGQPLRMIKHATNRTTQNMLKAMKAGQPITGTYQTAIGAMPANMVADALLKNNHIGTGFSSMLHTPGTYERLRKIFKNQALGLSFRTNQVVEDSMKAGAFINFLEQGMSVRQASMALAKSMPDLTMLTTFERNVMRRVFPFFSWYRRNGALQLFHYLPNYPAWSAAAPKLRNAVQMAMVGDQAVDAQLRPSWQEEAQATQILGDSEAGSVFLLGSWLPFDDMVAVLGAAESPQDFMREMLERASPAAKFGAEMAVGVDIFRQRPIPKFTPQEFIFNAPKAIIGASGSPLDNLLGIRPIKEYGRRVWEQPTLAAGITRGLIGGAIQPVSRERGLIAQTRELREKAQVLRSKLNRAVENRDKPEIQLLTRELFRVWAQMMEQGLPGVPKAAQAMMSQRGIEAGEPAFQ